MNPIDLLKLAEQADKEGRYAIADKLTIRATRIAAPPLPEVLQAGERGLVHGLETGATEAERAAAEAILARMPGGGPGHVANTGNIGSTVNTQGGIHGSPMTMTEKVGQEIEQEIGQVAKNRTTNQTRIDNRQFVKTKTGDKIYIKDLKYYSPEELAAIKANLGPKELARVENHLTTKVGKPVENFNKQKAQIGDAKQTGSTGGGDSMKMEAPVSTSTGGVTQSGSPFVAGPRSKVFNVSEGSTMNMGVSNAALLGGMGIVGALGAIGMYLGKDGYVRDRDNIVVAPQNIPTDIAKRLPRYQMMTRREEAGQLGGQKALNAQNFVDMNASNPRLKNQRDWYNYALQISGGDKNFANNVISYVKASPEMPSQVGGGPNI
jgi:hypothetical protein